MDDTILSAQGLNLYYGPTHALKDVSIDIPEKKVTSLIGPSGCGKSTFLKTLDRMNDLVPACASPAASSTAAGRSMTPAWM